MKCSICKNSFIVTKDNKEYNYKKTVYDNKVCEIINNFIYEEFRKYYDNIWHNLLLYEALLLQPNQISKNILL